MVSINTKKQKLVDFSFMPSLKCNLSCPHCMYKASPNNTATLDLEKTAGFISTINFSKINAFGFYGGEISSDYKNYQKTINLTPENIVRFTITNGAWSVDKSASKQFIDFTKKNNLKVFVSTSKFHRPFQNSKLLHKISQEQDFILKGEDKIIPMGRAKTSEKTTTITTPTTTPYCSQKCKTYTSPIRLTLHTSGDIMFCNCDGVYPIVGTYEDNFKKTLKNSLAITDFCFRATITS
jgi:hypothetical protein